MNSGIGDAKNGGLFEGIAGGIKQMLHVMVVVDLVILNNLMENRSNIKEHLGVKI